MEILVATDFSQSADAALSVAGQYARALHARVHVLHVSEVAAADVTRPTAEVTTQVGNDVSITLVGRTGDPAGQILLYAALHAIDLIVIGTHGRTGVSRVLLGSVAERVIRGAGCPVLVVPRRVRAAAGASTVAAAEQDMTVVASQERPCVVCAKPTHDLICEPCRARIRGEALEHKQHEERSGRRA
jgi:nucleotide-binding universal stress UspA family protein